jgi:hypothetical protein
MTHLRCLPPGKTQAFPQSFTPTPCRNAALPGRTSLRRESSTHRQALEGATIASFETNHAQVGPQGLCFLSACYRKAEECSHVPPGTPVPCRPMMLTGRHPRRSLTIRPTKSVRALPRSPTPRTKPIGFPQTKPTTVRPNEANGDLGMMGRENGRDSPRSGFPQTKPIPVLMC